MFGSCLAVFGKKHRKHEKIGKKRTLSGEMRIALVGDSLTTRRPDGFPTALGPVVAGDGFRAAYPAHLVRLFQENQTHDWVQVAQFGKKTKH
jgi:hypothetical protein